ncbi:MAG: UbiX family flavin prenyltransferase [Spirochaetia bacterium]|nr:UbiX family flavin prenyltransferase [Spirochaetia bacterium]
MTLRLVIGITGASGSLYAVELIRALHRLVPGESDIVVSPAAFRVYESEMGRTLSGENDLARAQAFINNTIQSDGPGQHTFKVHAHDDVGAPPASGSRPCDGMIVIPCSMNMVSSVACGRSTNLIERAADVCLKERRRLILVPRETPYSRTHLKNMLEATDAGAVILPASPAFYQKPREFSDLGRFIAGRALALFGVKHDLFKPWDGEASHQSD